MKYLVLTFIVIFMASYVQPKGAPVAVFHGIGDSCMNPGMKSIVKFIASETDSIVKCISIGSNPLSSLYMGMEQQAEEGCKKILEDPDFDEEFSVFGISQGALHARYIIQKCDTKYPVRNYVSIGGPQFGVGSVPHCFSGPICYVLNWAVHQIIYNSFVQTFVGPAGYYRDASHVEIYKKNSKFLASLNNEVDDKDDTIKEKFSSLNKAIFIMFEDDTMIYPAETAVFGELQKDKSILPVTETQLYLDDWIGLRELDEQGKIEFMSLPGDHLTFSTDDISEYMVPVLIA